MNITDFVRQHAPISVRRAVFKIRNPKLLQRVSTFNRLLERINAGDVLIHSDNLEGEFWLDVRSHLLRRIAVSGVYEPEVANVLVENAGGDFIDVGANVGFFSIHLAKQPGSQKVLAIEPNPRAFEYLQRNLEQNNVADKIEIVRCAAASKSEELELVSFEGREEYSSISSNIHPSVQGLEPTRYKVQADPLDSILEGRGLTPGLIKIDAEGAELEVLKGMEATMQTHRPTLLCEVGGSTFGTDVSEVEAQLKKMNYKILSLNGEPTVVDPKFGGEIIARPIS